MKTLILIRHGKSDWTAGVSDMKRPLNHRGLNDAPLMAKVLLQKSQIPEIMYVSSAKRTTQTANILAQELSIPQDNIVTSPELYLCDSFAVEEIVRYAPEAVDRIAIVGHNPTLSEVSSYFSNEDYTDLPTLAISFCTFNTKSWEDVSPENLKEHQLFFPKMFN